MIITGILSHVLISYFGSPICSYSLNFSYEVFALSLFLTFSFIFPLTFFLLYSQPNILNLLARISVLHVPVNSSFRSILSYISSHLISCHLVLSCLVLSYLILFILFYLILSCLVLSCLVLSRLVLSYLISSHLIYLILSYLILYYLVIVSYLSFCYLISFHIHI